MRHLLVSLGAACSLVGAAGAQCFSNGTSSIVGPGFVKWSSGSGYASTFDVDDEGITNPPIALTAFAAFPMAGAVGTLNQLWVNSNGEVYLTDSALALTQPVGGSSFGTNSLAEARGNIAGGSARIFPLGGDHEMSAELGAAWDVRVDQNAIAGTVKITWIDMARYVTPTDRFSFSCTLSASGAVEFSYGQTFPTGFSGRYVGLSIGNLVGTATSPSRDLTGGPVASDSGTEGLLYENFATAGSFDLNGKTLLLTPNGTGGYFSVVTCQPASNTPYGLGCYSYQDPNQAIYQQWLDAASSAAALPPGTSVTFTPNVNGYVVTYGGGSYVAPTGAATILGTLTDDSETSATPSVPFPYLSGPIATLAIGSNGHVAMAASPSGLSVVNYGSTATFLSQPAASFRSNSDYNPAEAGSGKVKTQEAVDGSGNLVFYVTWDGVERYSSTVVNPETFQFQLALSGPDAGRVRIVWQTMTTLGTQDLLVGYAPAAPNLDPGSINLAAALPITTATDITLLPLALAADVPPVCTPMSGTVVNYTTTNMVEVGPATSLYLGIHIISFGAVPPFDLGIIGAPGCFLHVVSLDILTDMFAFTPTHVTPITYPAGTPAGLKVYAQTVCLFDPAHPLPNGQNAFGVITSNAIESYVNSF